MSPRPMLVAVAMLTAVAFGGQACGRSDSESTAITDTPMPTVTSTPTATPTPTIDVRKLLEDSGGTMEDLDSFQFSLEHPSGGTALLSNLLIQRAEGRVMKPDKLFTEFSGSFGGFVIKTGVITLGDDSYMTNPLSGEWESVPAEVSPLGFFDPRRGIAAIMAQLVGVRLVPDGRGVYRVDGELAAEALAPLLGATVEGAIIAAELTIDADNLYLLEATLDGRVTSGEPDGTVRVIKLSRFNEAFSIEAPK